MSMSMPIRGHQHLSPPSPFPLAWLLIGLLAPGTALGQTPLPTQSLPIRAQVCGPVEGKQENSSLPAEVTCVALEVPATPGEYATGLMGRSQLPPEQGMWFRFDQDNASFWMKNTLIPLDLVFLERYDPDTSLHEESHMARIVTVAHDVQPCNATPCPTYKAGQPVDHVVELATGEAQRRNWVEDTVLIFSWLAPDQLGSGHSESELD